MDWLRCIHRSRVTHYWNRWTAIPNVLKNSAQAGSSLWKVFDLLYMTANNKPVHLTTTKINNLVICLFNGVKKNKVKEKLLMNF